MTLHTWETGDKVRYIDDEDFGYAGGPLRIYDGKIDCFNDENGTMRASRAYMVRQMRLGKAVLVEDEVVVVTTADLKVDQKVRVTVEGKVNAKGTKYVEIGDNEFWLGDITSVEILEDVEPPEPVIVLKRGDIYRTTSLGVLWFKSAKGWTNDSYVSVPVDDTEVVRWIRKGDMVKVNV